MEWSRVSTMEIRLAAREIEYRREAEVVMRFFAAFEQNVGRENEKITHRARRAAMTTNVDDRLAACG